MDAMEIILLIAGGIIFILSFAVPVRKEEVTEGTKELVKEEIRQLAAGEIQEVKEKVSDIVEETVTYSVEKTERSLERMSNEKIMAVNEYSNTVLEEINKNHKEVMFLYDMLNDKHEHLKAAAADVEKVIKQAGETVKEADPVQAGIKSGAAGNTVPGKAAKKQTGRTEAAKTGGREPDGAVSGQYAPIQPDRSRKAADAEGFRALSTKTPSKKAVESAPDISFTSQSQNDGQNNNNRILDLHNAGSSNVAIAKELGLGIGEVKLVIDLFEGM